MDSESNETSTSSQIQKYADDLTRLFKSGKEKDAELKATHGQMIKYAEALNETVAGLKEANNELRESYLDTIHRLVLAAELKDEDTGDHIVRMSRYCALLAGNLGWSEKSVSDVLYAAPMHDLGKIGIPDRILLKPGKLSDDEFEMMKSHTTTGAKILAGAKATVLRLGQEIAISHHEKWDGTGYPQGLREDRIPQIGRMVAIADTFDALTSRRPYKDPYPIEVACKIISDERGKHFDPEIVDIFLACIDDIVAIKSEINPDTYDSNATFAWSERDRLQPT